MSSISGRFSTPSAVQLRRRSTCKTRSGRRNLDLNTAVAADELRPHFQATRLPEQRAQKEPLRDPIPRVSSSSASFPCSLNYLSDAQTQTQTSHPHRSRRTTTFLKFRLNDVPSVSKIPSTSPSSKPQSFCLGHDHGTSANPTSPNDFTNHDSNPRPPTRKLPQKPMPGRFPSQLGLGLPTTRRRRVSPTRPDAEERVVGGLTASYSVAQDMSSVCNGSEPPSTGARREKHEKQRRMFSSTLRHLQVAKFSKRTLHVIPEEGCIGATMRKIINSPILGPLKHKLLF